MEGGRGGEGARGRGKRGIVVGARSRVVLPLTRLPALLTSPPSRKSRPPPQDVLVTSPYPVLRLTLLLVTSRMMLRSCPLTSHGS
eukprot:564935-Rhodomonas_salina.1